MEFFKSNMNINFMALRRYTFMFSILITLLSIASNLWLPLNLSMEFTGGHQIVLTFDEAQNVGDLRDALEQHHPELNPSIQTYGSDKSFMFKFGTHSDDSNGEQSSIINALDETLPPYKLTSKDVISAQMGKSMLAYSIVATLIAMVITMIYIALRFEYRFAIAAILSLIHDPVLILGVFSFFHIEFTMITLAALLTTLGYSLNDTIVVYDRIRENFRKFVNKTPVEIVNLSINETLSRTIITSGLTALSVLALLLFGGETLYGFSLAFLIGIVIGTYSSIYIAGSLAVLFGFNSQSLLTFKQKYQGELDEYS